MALLAVRCSTGIQSIQMIFAGTSFLYPHLKGNRAICSSPLSKGQSQINQVYWGRTKVIQSESPTILDLEKISTNYQMFFQQYKVSTDTTVML